MKKKDPSSQPYLRFFHSPELRARTLALLGELEADEDPRRHGKALAELVLELTAAGLEYYFVLPLQTAKAGFVAERSAKFGIASFLSVMGPLSRRILGGMEAPQLLAVTAHIRVLMA